MAGSSRNRIMSIVMVAVLALGLAPQLGYAAGKKAPKPAQAQEKLVLMPLRLSEEDRNLQGAMETALVEGLQGKYEVFAGEQVQKKVREAFNKESAKHDCDETRCMQNIAIAFQAELIAVANITRRSDGYFLALSIQNIFDDKVVYSVSIPCKGCDAYQVVDKLKELVVTTAQTIAAPPAEPEAPKVTGTDPESATWAEAQRGNTVDDYQVYLDSYPKGKYIAFAKARIKKLHEAAQAAAEQQEQQAWEAAQQESSEESYNRYLSGYPNGRYTAFAKTRIGKLKTDLAFQEESELWKKAESGMDRTSVEAYLNQYPKGRYIGAASAKLTAIKAEEAKGPRPGQTFKDCSECAEMIVIPAGRFSMGSNNGDEAPAHSVTLKTFAIGKYEVTQAQWQAVMGDNPSYFKQCGGNCPVESVSWNDIQEFIQKLNQKSGKSYRLPSEAEWEYACKAGKNTEYCGGDDVNAAAWYIENSNKTTHPAGQKQANAFGLYDMSGNVWEWVQDNYHANYTGAPADGSAWEGGGEVGRVLRGGSWGDVPLSDRAANRFGGDAADRYVSFGFRLARTLP